MFFVLSFIQFVPSLRSINVGHIYFLIACCGYYSTHSTPGVHLDFIMINCNYHLYPQYPISRFFLSGCCNILYSCPSIQFMCILSKGTTCLLLGWTKVIGLWYLSYHCFLTAQQLNDPVKGGGGKCCPPKSPIANLLIKYRFYYISLFI